MRKYLYLAFVKLIMKWYDIFNSPKASLVLLFNNKDEILSVSRKDNFSDKNLIGGKVDKNETFINAAIRECYEETGITIYNLRPVFFRKDGIYKCITFIADYYNVVDEISDKETGEIKWIKFDELLNGSFYHYNKKLQAKLLKFNLTTSLDEEGNISILISK
jgi:8-oxo-dGTP pyrophosphatase MutT (NUDIX family)